MPRKKKKAEDEAPTPEKTEELESREPEAPVAEEAAATPFEEPPPAKAEAAIPEKEEAKGPVPQAVSLLVFRAVSGVKWDQLAGFLRYAKTKGMGPRAIPEWHDAYKAFLARPVR